VLQEAALIVAAPAIAELGILHGNYLTEQEFM
jgi:hypothetical protein